MLYTLAAILVALVAIYIAYKSFNVLWRNSWIAGFFRGLFGLGLLAFGVVVALLAFDIYSYKQILSEQAIATINFKQLGNQHYDAVLVDKEGHQQNFQLRGDQWQLDARVIKWQGYFATFNIRPAYRLERISGRYYDIEQETSAKRTAYVIHPSLYGIDLWRFINKNPEWVPVIDAAYGSATYLPMSDGALYEVTLSHTGLLARPLNDSARDAVAEFN